MRRYAVAHLDNLDSFPVAHGLEWHPIRRRFGIRSFGVNAYTAEKPGDWVVEEHKEGSGHEELYLVVRGRARFTLDGEERDAPAGTIVFLPDASVPRGPWPKRTARRCSRSAAGRIGRSSPRAGSGPSRRTGELRTATSKEA